MQKNEQHAAQPTAAGGDRQKGKRPRSTSPETSTQITINLDE